MAQITRSTKVSGGTILVASTLARAVDVETDVLTLFNAHNNHDSGSSTWTVVSAAGSTSVPLVVNNSTGTQDIAQFKDNGSTVWSIADGGNLVSASKKITGLAAGTTSGDSVRFEQLITNTPWAAYTPTITGGGTVSGVSIFWRQTGDTIYVMGSFSTGTVAAATASMTVPSGKTIDHAKLATSTGSYLGHALLSLNGAFNSTACQQLIFGDGTANTVFFNTSGNTGGYIQKANGSAIWGSNQFVYVNFQVPVTA